MIRVYFKKLENGNLEITQDMLIDILSYMKRQDNEKIKLREYIKSLEENEEYLKKGFADLYKRIDDAIEYANSIPTQKVIRVFKKEILDILNGDDNE